VVIEAPSGQFTCQVLLLERACTRYRVVRITDFSHTRMDLIVYRFPVAHPMADDRDVDFEYETDSDLEDEDDAEDLETAEPDSL
jgi:hypothetical protein